MAHAIHHPHKHSFHLQRRRAQQPKQSFWTHLSTDTSLWVSLVMLAFGLGLIGYALSHMGTDTPTLPRDAASISYD